MTDNASAHAEELPPPAAMVGRAILLLCEGKDRREAAAALAGEFAAAAIGDAAERIVAAAVETLSETADYNRDYQLAIAMRRLDSVYRQAMADEGSLAVAVSAQRELNRLLGLHQPLKNPDAKEDDPADDRPEGRSATVENAELAALLDAIDGQLDPLAEIIGAEPEDTDPDVIRRAADYIRQAAADAKKPKRPPRRRSKTKKTK